MSESEDPVMRWYSGVTPYQWLVLVIASAGWVFDTFEGQLFNITRDEMLRELLVTSGSSSAASMESARKFWGDVFLAVFLVGGTVGGIAFGSLADRYGRKPMLSLTILFYSLFSGLTFGATELWHVAVMRFFVALGVGGEWAVAASLVAEIFPQRARAHAAGIFHATSVGGTWLAAAAGLLVGTQWRYAYLIGILPALLILSVRANLHEPESWSNAETQKRTKGSFRELFGNAEWARRAILGLALAAVGLGTFWGVTVAGQSLVTDMLKRQEAPLEIATQKAKFAYGFWQALGGGLGLLAFGPLAERLGRRPAFALMHGLSLLIVPLTCYVPQSYEQLLCFLPFYGACTLGIHAGYAIYFPELFPSHLRATGSGVCFNGGRLLAAPILIFSGMLKGLPGMDLRSAVSMLSLLFLVGFVILWWLPETRGQSLPD